MNTSFDRSWDELIGNVKIGTRDRKTIAKLMWNRAMERAREVVANRGVDYEIHMLWLERVMEDLRKEKLSINLWKCRENFHSEE